MTFDARRYRLVAILVLGNHLACYGWQTQRPTPQQVLEGRRPTAIRVERTGGLVTELGEAALVCDSIVGTWLAGAGPLERWAVAVTQASLVRLTLQDGRFVDLRQPGVAGDSVVGWVQGWASLRGGVLGSEVRTAHLRLLDGKDLTLRAITVVGDSLTGVGSAPDWAPERGRTRMAIPLSDARAVSLRKPKPAAIGFTILGTTLVVALAAAVIVCSQTDCMDLGFAMR